MAAPATIDKAMTLKTMSFEPALVWAIEGADTLASIDDFHRVFLYWGETFDQDTKALIRFDQSKRAVRRALQEAISIGRAIDAVDQRQAAPDEHLAIFERIRAFASAYGAMWGVTFPDPLPRHMEGRKLAGSMLEWYRELLTLLDVYELRAIASGRCEDRALHGKVQYEQDGKRAVFTSRGRQSFALASREQKVTVQLPWQGKPQVIELWQLVHGKSTVLAWVILTAVCKANLDKRINIGLHPSERNSLAITPDGIIPTLYARLWLDTLRQETDLEMVRLCQRPGCENPIPTGARVDAQYCSPTCQKSDRRRLLRLERSRMGTHS